MNYLNFGLSKSIYEENEAIEYGYNQAGYNSGNGWWRNQGRIKPPQQLNVYHFKIAAWNQVGIYLVVKINYPSAKHYEGNKVLVYEGITIDDLKQLKAIDPHFLPNKEKPSPIARFEPTDEGWVYAMKFCSMLHSERVELAY